MDRNDGVAGVAALRSYVDGIWNGDVPIEEFHTGSANEEEHMRRLRGGRVIEVAPGVAFWPARSNVTAVRSPEGLTLIDSGEAGCVEEFLHDLRGWSQAPIHAVILTHGHPDHTGGLFALDADAESAGRARPRVIAHESVRDRFGKYERSSEYNAVVNRRQFQNPSITWPNRFRYPDKTYWSDERIEIDGIAYDLHHGRGETDDATWVWIPDKRILCSGDFFMWVAPNAGNPQKSQRYAWDWARALRAMVELGAELLLPGHGLPIFGAQRVQAALEDTASFLESLHDQTLEMMNRGVRLDEIIHSVVPPDHLFDRPYLRPIFDDPEFVVRNVWRYYGGWYGGNPATLKPAPEAALARELCALAGGASRLVERAEELAAKGEWRLASHLVYTAVQAAPDDVGVLRATSSIFSARAESERSRMARSIFMEAAANAKARLAQESER